LEKLDEDKNAPWRAAQSSYKEKWNILQGNEKLISVPVGKENPRFA